MMNVAIKRVNLFDKETFPHPRREEMVLKSVNAFKLADIKVERITQVPPHVRLYFSTLPYYVIVRSLCYHDRLSNGLSLRQLSIKYGVSYEKVRYMFNMVQDEKNLSKKIQKT